MMNWSDYFVLDECTPSGLRWNVDVFDSRGRKTRARVGAPAGSLSGQGRWQVGLQLDGKRKTYRAHRIIYELLHGEIPEGMVVDHVDGDERNNLHANLRAVTVAGNCRNRRRTDRNSTGVVGVSVCVKNGRQYVRVGLGDKELAHLSINKYGYEQAFAMACALREAAINKANAEGAGYTERHGKDSRDEPLRSTK